MKAASAVLVFAVVDNFIAEVTRKKLATTESWEQNV
jgi:hypothetical protein